MRTKYIAGNRKMNMDRAGAVDLAKALVSELKGLDGSFMIAPPFVYLDAVASVIKGSNIRLGAQNAASTENGAHTGEVSVAMLKDIGVQSVILGHSERRDAQNESDKLINEKILAVLNGGLEVVLCIGEQYSQRIAGATEEVCGKQVRGCLKGLTPEQMKNVVIAYEPVWAIGTGKTATPEEANAVHKFVRGVLAEMFGNETAENTKILYGGSMNDGNAEALLAQPDIDGGLIGGASLKADKFSAICRFSVK